MNTDDEQFPHTDVAAKAPAARPRVRLTRSRAWLLALCLGACIGAVACGGEVDSDGMPTDLGPEMETQTSALVIMDEAPPAAAGPCVVTDGPRAGMKGVYDSDGWCCSTRSNVCVECGDTAKCKNAVKPATSTLPSANAALAR